MHKQHTMTTTELAGRYGVSALTLLAWRNMRTFPIEAVFKLNPGSPAMWNPDAVDAWLRSRPRHRQQRPARWWGVVGIDGYPNRKQRVAR